MPTPEHDHTAAGVEFYAATPAALREHMRERHGWDSDHPFDQGMLADHGANVREHLAEHYSQLVQRGAFAPLHED